MLPMDRPEKPKKIYTIPKQSAKRKAAIEAGTWKPKERKPITPKPVKITLVSKTRSEALKVYRRKRDDYFKAHPVCEYPGCNSKQITLHHMRGRVGSFLTDKRYFKSLCQPHHDFCEQNPNEAKRLGLSQNRLDKHK